MKTKSSQANRNCAALKLPLAAVGCLLFIGIANAQPRIAILDFTEEIIVSQQLRKLAGQSEFNLLDYEQQNAAVKGSGYQQSLNLSVVEARALGLSIGCDYYLLGVARKIRRLASEKKFYFDVLIGAFLVETRSGKLLRFAFEQAQAPTEALAAQQLETLAQAVWKQSTEAIKSISEKADGIQQTEIYDLSSDEAVRLAIKPPRFYRRLKPAYTEIAEFAGIAATIELNVVFQADGQIGAIEVIRWGGFGLDESSIATARQLRFEPARLDGRPVNVRAVVQYNFRKEEKAK